MCIIIFTAGLSLSGSDKTLKRTVNMSRYALTLNCAPNPSKVEAICLAVYCSVPSVISLAAILEIPNKPLPIASSCEDPALKVS